MGLVDVIYRPHLDISSSLFRAHGPVGYFSSYITILTHRPCWRAYTLPVSLFMPAVFFSNSLYMI